MWLHSSQYRASPANEEGQRGAHALGPGTADPRCVSHHHDADSCAFGLAGAERWCDRGGRNRYMRSWRRRWKTGAARPV